ncbi:MCE family protein [Mycobacterium sp. AZCC_0083]|uniref:MCE family protein n=1 Tax=Mycobacterium sp. AZCC_0083 TaxID=2735882 RepID=UPI00161906A7|nr:MCE family protein [Mycobacterium sp. AZCC_0083]
MKMFAERNPIVIGALGVGFTVAVMVAALNYRSLPLLNHTDDYAAYFADASGLYSGSDVEVSGAGVGKVTSIALDGPRVLVKFTVADDIPLGDRTEVDIKTKSLLGAKVIDVTPRGQGTQSGTIPLDRTTSAYQLPDALGDVTAAISGLNTDQLSQSLAVLSDTFKDTPPDLKAAIVGVTRFSDTLDRRDGQLRSLLTNASRASAVLSQRSDEIAKLIADTDDLLAELRTQSSALEQIAGNLSAVSRQIKGFITDNRDTFKPALDKLNGVLTIVDNRRDKLQESIKKLDAYALSLGESVGSGPFFKAYLANLIPGQFIQPFVDAAFSDLGLDPSTLLPSQRTDPQVGQPGTPALPIPYPRTGQGGSPNLSLPDAITGKPGDSRYPYREPLPAPAPGGPPPGPPALPPDGVAPPVPTSVPVYQQAPGEVPPFASAAPPPAAPASSGGDSQ